VIVNPGVRLAIDFATQGTPVSVLAEALINEITKGHLSALMAHDPHALIYHPQIEQGGERETIDWHTRKKRNPGEDVTRYTDDLRPEVRAQFRSPKEGAYRKTDLTVVKAHMGHPLYSRSAVAPNLHGKPSGRPAPSISGEHLDLMTHAAKGQAESRHWYEHIAPHVQRIFDSPHYKDSHMIMGLLAAYSPQTHPHPNVHKALRGWRDLIQGKPLIGSHSDNTNALRAAHGMHLSGPKVHWYNRNMQHGITPTATTPTGDPIGSVDHPTNDRHMKYAFLRDYDDETVHPEQHVAITQATRHVANKLGWGQHQAQAAVWAHDIRTTGLNDPSFHTPGSPFKKLSQRYGGYLPVVDDKKPIQDYGQFFRENEHALRGMKHEMDQYRMYHPNYREHAGKGTPFLFHPAGIRGAAIKYGHEVSAEHLSNAREGKAVLTDLKNRDITRTDPKSGWEIGPTSGAFTGRKKDVVRPNVSFVHPTQKRVTRKDLKNLEPAPF